MKRRRFTFSKQIQSPCAGNQSTSFYEHALPLLGFLSL
jgi:hypothetical protein